MSLPLALIVFLVTASVVVFCGTKLAKYGDLLAIKTGWGRLWVGTLLLAGATSLPELVTGASGALLDAPELVKGNVFGANMVNMFVLAAVSMFFGAVGIFKFAPLGSYPVRLLTTMATGSRRFFDGVAREHAYLASVGVCLTAFAGIMGVYGPQASFGHMGIATPIILLLYVAGMKVVYAKRPLDEGDEDEDDTSITLRRVWAYFGLAALGVIASAYWMAYSADQIAEITGLGAGFVGVVAVALVTTLPEATVTIASIRIGAMDLAAGNVYGSCAFNVMILAVADPFYSGGAILSSASPDASLVAAAGFAVALMLIGMAQFTLRRQGRGILPSLPASGGMCVLYIVGLYVIYALEQTLH